MEIVLAATGDRPSPLPRNDYGRSRTLVILLGLALVVACQDRDPLSPLAPPRRVPPKVSRTLSGNLAVANPTDINAAGEVVGTIPFGTVSHAAISLNGTAYDLGTIDQSSTTGTYPTAINGRGEVVGWESRADGTTYAFLWIPSVPNGTTGTMQRLPDSQSGPAYAMGINDAGEIVGNLASGSGLVLWTGRGAGVTELPSPYPGNVVTGDYINGYGQIATTLQDVDGVYHPYVWTPVTPNGVDGRFTALDGGPADYGWTAAGLNDDGQVIINTYFGDAAMLWTPSSPNGTTFTPTALDALWASAINSRGDVLVTNYGPNSDLCGVTYHVYLWRPATPNATTAPASIDVTPDVGTGPFESDCAVYAYSGIVSEEENGSIQAFGTLSDWNGNVANEMWTATDLGVPRPLKPAITWSGVANEGTDVYFDGSRTTPYGSGLQYQWDFGDGSTGAGVNVLHRFADNGSYTVRLTVSDATGQTASTTVAVVVSNLAPTATFRASPTTVNEGGTYVLSVANVSDVLADLASVRVSLDCGDGQGYQPVATTGSVTCAAPNEAARVARAQLVDKDGGVSQYSATITVLDVAPVVTILSAPATVDSQKDYTISFRFSDPGVLDQWSYSINWGDGSTTSTTSVASQGTTITGSHRFNLPKKGGVKSATYTVTVTVWDNGGASGSANVPVQVTAVPGRP